MSDPTVIYAWRAFRSGDSVTISGEHEDGTKVVVTGIVVVEARKEDGSVFACRRDGVTIDLVGRACVEPSAA